MKAIELRIGNYVNYTIDDDLDLRKKWKEPIQIDAEDLVWLEQNTQDNDYEYIVLTEEWFFKFGNFSRLKTGVFSIFESFIFIYKKAYDCWYVVSSSNEYLTKIKYVHELQNLIFALREQELNVLSDSTQEIEKIDQSLSLIYFDCNHKTDLKKLAEIERDFNTFGSITYEQQQEKTAILNKYE
jgi:hypothetical protein